MVFASFINTSLADALRFAGNRSLAFTASSMPEKLLSEMSQSLKFKLKPVIFIYSISTNSTKSLNLKTANSPFLFFSFKISTGVFPSSFACSSTSLNRDQVAMRFFHFCVLPFGRTLAFSLLLFSFAQKHSGITHSA